MLKTAQFEEKKCVNRMKIDDFRDKYPSVHNNTINIRTLRRSIAWGSNLPARNANSKSDVLTTRPHKSVRKGEQISLFKLYLCSHITCITTTERVCHLLKACEIELQKYFVWVSIV